MRFLQASALVLVAALAVVSAGKPTARPSFSEWLDKKTGKALPSSVKPAAASALNYDEVETETACLKEVNIKNCRCIGCSDPCSAETSGDCLTAPQCCQTLRYDSTLGCCDERNYASYHYDRQPESFLSILPQLEIGSCDVTLNYFDSDVTVDTGCVKKGMYSILCDVSNGDECGHPFCDSMQLKAEGVIYQLDEAISLSNTSYPKADGSCSGWDGTKAAVPIGKKATKGPAHKVRKAAGRSARKADVAEVAYFVDDPIEVLPNELPHTYYKSSAQVWHGPVTVTSRKYNIKYHHGTLEYGYWMPEYAVAISEAEAHASDYWLVNPFTYTLKLNKPHDY